MKKKILKLIFIFGIIFSGTFFANANASALEGSIEFSGTSIFYVSDSDSHTWYDENGGTAVYQTTGQNSGTLTLNSFSEDGSAYIEFSNDETFNLEIILNGNNVFGGSFFFRNSNVAATFSGSGSLKTAQIMDLGNLTFLSGTYDVIYLYATQTMNFLGGIHSVERVNGSCDIYIDGATFAKPPIFRPSGDIIIKNTTLDYSYTTVTYDIQGDNISIEGSTLIFSSANNKANINIYAQNDITVKGSTVSYAAFMSCDGKTYIEDSYFNVVDLYGLEDVTINNSHFNHFSSYMYRLTANDSEFKNIKVLMLYDKNVLNNCTLEYNPADEYYYNSGGVNQFGDVELNNSHFKMVNETKNEYTNSLIVMKNLLVNGGDFEIENFKYGVRGSGDYATLTFRNADVNIYDVKGEAIVNTYGSISIEDGANVNIKNAGVGIYAYDLFIKGGLTNIENANIGINFVDEDGTFSITGGDTKIINSGDLAFSAPYSYEYDDDYNKVNVQMLFTLDENMTYEIPGSSEKYSTMCYSFVDDWNYVDYYCSYLPESVAGYSDADRNGYATKNIHFYPKNGGHEDNLLSVSATISARISLELSSNNVNLMIGSPAFVTDSIDATVDTNSFEGYTLSVKTDDDTNALMPADKSNSSSIPSIPSSYTAANFPATGWGYSIDGGANFNAIPTENYSLFTTNINGGNTHNFGIGIRADFRDITADSYSNNLIFTAVVNL